MENGKSASSIHRSHFIHKGYSIVQLLWMGPKRASIVRHSRWVLVTGLSALLKLSYQKITVVEVEEESMEKDFNNILVYVREQPSFFRSRSLFVYSGTSSSNRWWGVYRPYIWYSWIRLRYYLIYAWLTHYKPVYEFTLSGKRDHFTPWWWIAQTSDKYFFLLCLHMGIFILISRISISWWTIFYWTFILKPLKLMHS